MGKNTSISLGSHFEEFITEKVNKGRFNNASEVIRAGLRLLEFEEKKMQLLRDAINEGLESKVIKDYEPMKHLDEIKAKFLKNA
ncbi:MAG: type II toxin-antitoxin system ParD family antitoxin [Leadbetterella sp.]|nr:type II toxin-antitoxin system ParD family antitoxin [Leadbetterella sp.]